MTLYRITVNGKMICVNDQLDYILFAMNALVAAGVSGVVFEELKNNA